MQLRWIRHWLSTPYVGYASGDEGPKMINQYFNVYALRRVRWAGYATGCYDQLDKQELELLGSFWFSEQNVSK